jgi:hypothetical protein
MFHEYFVNIFFELHIKLLIPCFIGTLTVISKLKASYIFRNDATFYVLRRNFVAKIRIIFEGFLSTYNFGIYIKWL